MCGACSGLWEEGLQEILAVPTLLAKVLTTGEGPQGLLAHHFSPMVTGSPTACGDMGAERDMFVPPGQARVWSKTSSPRRKGSYPACFL